MGLAGQGRSADQRGYAMAALLVSMSVMAVLMGAALPVWSHATQREREEELIWRGEQYRRAIMLFQRKYANTFPPTVDILVEQKFLRKKYKDPVTDDEFQIIPVGGAQPGVPGLGGAAGGNKPGTTQPGGANPGAAPLGAGAKPGGPSGSGFGSQQNTGFGTQQNTGFGSQQNTGFGSPQNSGFGSQQNTAGGAGPLGAPGGAGGFGQPAAQGGFGSGTPGTQLALGIQGVTSKSKKTSIKLYNGMNTYNQWAFVYLASSGQAGAGGQQFGKPGQTGGFGQPGQAQPGGFGQPGGGFGAPAGGFGQPANPGGGFGQPGGMSQPTMPPVPGGGFGQPGGGFGQPGGLGQPKPPGAGSPVFGTTPK
jgi:type II secretory pathway pseudopilin PulG